MKTKEKLCALYKKLDEKFLAQFGFNIRNTSFEKIVEYMYAPKDSSSLAITRILFGLTMLVDTTEERGGTRMAARWGDPNMCHFPLIPVLQPMPMPYMVLVYVGLWFGALGIMLGYKFSISARMFATCYWYLFLIEKSYWNNHSYLFGLVAILISCTDAACYWSVDTYLNPSKKKQTVPYWNYFILKYQFFILYFMAGMKKSGPEWLAGYSMQRLSEHWVFAPFKLFLTVEQIDFWVVHLFVFVFDLTIAVWMMYSYTRHVAMVFCALFHLMNSRMFAIGMFPWVCLATMPLFYPFDWPKIVANYMKIRYTKIHDYLHSKVAEIKQKNICECKNKDGNDEVGKRSTEKSDETVNDSLDLMENSIIDKTDIETKEITKTGSEELDNTKGEGIDDDNQHSDDQVPTAGSTKNKICKKKITICIIAFYVFLQAFLPYSHFITKGYNNWVNGLYGYSWDMMVHSWDASSIAVKVVDNDRNSEIFIDPTQYTPNNRWSTHGDMVYQYVHCLKKNLAEKTKEASCDDPTMALSYNLSIYVDIWYGMNGRFTQRIFDPRVDMLKATWAPFSNVPYLMPLLDDAIHWREDLAKIKQEVYSWANNSDVVFYADFPGYENEKFIPVVMNNVTLTILEGNVVFEQEVPVNRIGRSFKFTTNDKIKVPIGQMHKIRNIGDKPAFYMYTFFTTPENTTDMKFDDDKSKQKLPLFKELYNLFYGIYFFGKSVLNYLFDMFKFSQCN